VIVRINEFDPANAEPYSGWGAEGLRGPIEYDWPIDTHAFEVLILESDERQRQLAPAFRQNQLRKLLPEILMSLAEPDEQIVARIDGPFAPSELLPVQKHLMDADKNGRFSCSAIEKLDPAPGEPITSIRIHLTLPRLVSLCTDTDIGLERGTRLRLFLVPDFLVNPLLDVSDLDDERWGEILPRCGALLGSMRGMNSIYILTRRYDSSQARQRIVQRLLGPQAKSAGAS
jgi:hypothetical protein